jgi:hypothetical protein
VNAITKTLFIVLAFVSNTAFGWGFYSHKLINRHAVYLLPNQSLFQFFKANIHFISENAVNPDKRRHTQDGEACRHYIDLDTYHHMGIATLPKYYNEAEKLIHEDSLNQHGILPWHIFHMQKSLTKAMQAKDAQAILHLAADLGHYIADANVPLHTTHNYDGQLTNQKGIHALWETRIPELYAKKYDYLIGKAEYIQDVQAYAWQTVHSSHAAVDSVLRFESAVSKDFKADEKYAFEERNHTTIRVYSRAFAQRYSNALQGQVERQMRNSIKMVADLWYTSWVEAGQPDLSTLIEKKEKNSTKETAEKESISEGQPNCDHPHIHKKTPLPAYK